MKINKEKFFKSIENLGLEELKELIKYLESNYQNIKSNTDNRIRKIMIGEIETSQINIKNVELDKKTYETIQQKISLIHDRILELNINSIENNEENNNFDFNR